MKKYAILGVLSALVSNISFAGEWVGLTKDDLKQFEVISEGAFDFADEGLYIKHKTEFPLSNVVTCNKKQFVAITDQRLIDRALSSLMYAMATSKTIRFYVKSFTHDYPLVTNIIVEQ